jgi:hypothetical protein
MTYIFVTTIFYYEPFPFSFKHRNCEKNFSLHLSSLISRFHIEGAKKCIHILSKKLY